ncbi:hypothetical protein T01_10034 [Trichinella spiralis]|uniref:Uncharacterized protein n=1 Tax=Trichinella spiralis TaxID=6334 RepID=A0A0V1BT68_TRISP|nr:hypothetical protein T01_10034 [Trichinella spiralis]
MLVDCMSELLLQGRECPISKRSKCPSECKDFFQECPFDQKFMKCSLCVLKCQKKVL